jgi:hypothetical protein
LNKNLRKFLTIEQMAEFGTHGLGLSPYISDRINIAALEDFAHHIRLSKLYGRKKTLEEAMISYLDTLTPR